MWLTQSLLAKVVVVRRLLRDDKVKEQWFLGILNDEVFTVVSCLFG